jgi:hypothetical protein
MGYYKDEKLTSLLLTDSSIQEIGILTIKAS